MRCGFNRWTLTTLGMVSRARFNVRPKTGTNCVNSAINLSALLDLTGAVEFRIIQIGTAAANGGATGGSGTFRVTDYFVARAEARNVNSRVQVSRYLLSQNQPPSRCSASVSRASVPSAGRNKRCGTPASLKHEDPASAGFLLLECGFLLPGAARVSMWPKLNPLQVRLRESPLRPLRSLEG
jgi:hypothetical protein